MRKISIHFQVNQPYLLRTYRFFDINQYHNYFDDYQNNYLIKRLSEKVYIPSNEMIKDAIAQHGDKISLSISISGSAISLLKNYAPHVLEDFKALLLTGQVELVGNTYSHSIASLYSQSAFKEQVQLQEKLLMEEFGVKPTSFCNTQLIYSDEIGEWLYEMGYNVVITEGARHILGWKNPGYVYCNPSQTDQKLLLRNYLLSDDIILRFQNKSWEHFPLTVEKYWKLLENQMGDAPYVNLCLDYETFGVTHSQESGIFEFFSRFLESIALSSDCEMITPSALQNNNEPSSALHVPSPISWSGDEKDIDEWLGNELQQEAFDQLHKLEPLYDASANENAKTAWLRLQNAIHFHCMSTKWFPTDVERTYFNNYSSPYKAFINYMNVLNDVKIQLQNNNQ